MVIVTETKASNLPPPYSEEEDEDGSLTQSTTGTTTDDWYERLNTVVTVTQSCMNRIERLRTQKMKQHSQEEDKSLYYYLRLYVDAGGCSGFEYKFEMDTMPLEEEEDVVLIAAKDDTNNPLVVIDKTSIPFVEGATIDYVQELIKAAFVVTDNPNTESACGCGTSFAVKQFQSNPALD